MLFDALPLRLVLDFFELQKESILNQLKLSNLSEEAITQHIQQIPTKLYSCTYDTNTDTTRSTPNSDIPSSEHVTDNMQDVYKTWSDITMYNMAMISTDYPVLQLDETTDLMLGLCTLRLYLAIQSFGIQTNKSFSASTSKKRVYFRDLLEHVRHVMTVRPERMIDLEGLPLCASPRLQFGKEWYGHIEQQTPNFIGRLQNCRYLIEISGVRRFISFEDGVNDATKNDLYQPEPTVQCYVNEERIAWHCACAVWSMQHELIQKHPCINQRPNQEELALLFTKHAALFRQGPFRRKYLSRLFKNTHDHQDFVYKQPFKTGFQNIPIIDYTAPDQVKATRILQESHLFHTKPYGRVFMHCAGGWGRTGMGLLLLTMALLPCAYNDDDPSKSLVPTSWDNALQIMFKRYKRQSIEEVWHLFHESFAYQKHWRKMDAICKRYISKVTPKNIQRVWGYLSSVLAPKECQSLEAKMSGVSVAHQCKEIEKALLRASIKFPIASSDGGTKTVTYHARNIPLFGKWIRDYFRLLQKRLPISQIQSNRQLAIRVGRPVYAPISQTELHQRMYEDDGVRKYVLLEREISNLNKTMKRQEQYRKSKKQKKTKTNTSIKVNHNQKPWETLSFAQKVKDVKRVFQKDYLNHALEGWTQEQIQKARNSIPTYIEKYPTYDSPGSIVKLIVEDRLLQESSTD